jgi:hypothetical protein
MAPSVRRDDCIFPNKLVSSRINPILATTRTSVEQQERFSDALSLVIHPQTAKLDSFGFFHCPDYALE